jgi:hypothetical protein
MSATFWRGNLLRTGFYKRDLAPRLLLLDGLVVAGNGGEGDTNCDGSFHLAMSAMSHHGYHDITVVERADIDKPSLDKKGECQSRPGKSVNRTYRLRYDGSRYPVPAALKVLGP